MRQRPEELYAQKNQAWERLFESIYGTAAAQNMINEQRRQMAAKRTEMLTRASAMLTAAGHTLTDWDVCYALAYSIGKAVDAFDSARSLENAAILCSLNSAMCMLQGRMAIRSGEGRACPLR